MCPFFDRGALSTSCFCVAVLSEQRMGRSVRIRAAKMLKDFFLCVLVCLFVWKVILDSCSSQSWSALQGFYLGIYCQAFSVNSSSLFGSVSRKPETIVAFWCSESAPLADSVQEVWPQLWSKLSQSVCGFSRGYHVPLFLGMDFTRKPVLGS